MRRTYMKEMLVAACESKGMHVRQQEGAHE
jgi:hypothetical protein